MIAGFIGIAVLILFLGFLAIFVRKKNAKKETQFKDLANRYQLEYYKTKSFFEGQKFQLKGQYKGIPIEIYEKVKGSGKQKVRYTIIKIESKDFGFKFSIGKENFLTRMGKWIGFNDIEFQDHELDRTFLFKSKDEQRFRSLINQEILAELSRIKESMKGAITFKDSALEYAVAHEMVDDLKRSQFEEVFPVLEKIASSKSFY